MVDAVCMCNEYGATLFVLNNCIICKLNLDRLLRNASVFVWAYTFAYQNCYSDHYLFSTIFIHYGRNEISASRLSCEKLRVNGNGFSCQNRHWSYRTLWYWSLGVHSGCHTCVRLCDTSMRWMWVMLEFKKCKTTRVVFIFYLMWNGVIRCDEEEWVSE